MAWFKKFAEPIALDDGSKLLTFRDAAKYIRALPQAEREAAHWKVAMKALTVVAERNAAELLARVRTHLELQHARAVVIWASPWESGVADAFLGQWRPTFRGAGCLQASAARTDRSIASAGRNPRAATNPPARGRPR